MHNFGLKMVTFGLDAGHRQLGVKLIPGIDRVVNPNVAAVVAELERSDDQSGVIAVRLHSSFDPSKGTFQVRDHQTDRPP